MEKRTNPGWPRWKRAVDNYKAKPESPGGKLFAARLYAANAALDALDALDAIGTLDSGPFAVVAAKGRVARWDGKAMDYSGHTDWKPKHYMCSSFCAALQATLDFSYVLTSGYADSTMIDTVYLADLLRGEEFSGTPNKIALLCPVRSAACRCCGRTIHPDGSVDGDPQVYFPNTTRAYDPTLVPVVEEEQPAVPAASAETVRVWVDMTDNMGDFVRESDCVLVTMTEREYSLFIETDGTTRKEFAAQHGAAQ